MQNDNMIGGGWGNFKRRKMTTKRNADAIVGTARVLLAEAWAPAEDQRWGGQAGCSLR